MGLDKPRETVALVSGTFTPSDTKTVTIPAIAGRDYVMITVGTAVTAFDTYDTILLIHIRDRYRVGYCNGQGGISVGNTDLISIDENGKVDMTNANSIFRVGTVYRYEAF